MTDTGLFFLAVLQAFTLIFLVIGLIGLLLPIFPGLTVMWVATLVYALIQSAFGLMTTMDWVLFGFITLLMLAGNIVDNIIIARHMRERAIPWSSILIGYAAGLVGSIFLTPLIGLLAAPGGLLVAEYWRLRTWDAAFASTKAYMTGWGFSLLARLGIGVVMIGLWMLWAFL